MTAEESRYISEVATRERMRLLGFIRQRIRSSEDAEDILQDVLYQFLRGFEDIRSTERITSWLFRVARNRITDYYRKKKPEPFSNKSVVSGEEDGAPLMLEDILPALTRDPQAPGQDSSVSQSPVSSGSQVGKSISPPGHTATILLR